LALVIAYWTPETPYDPYIPEWKVEINDRELVGWREEEFVC
jgi:hypothetical protein